MRIALVGRRFDPAGGGTERDLIVTARLLAAAGHAVRIYAAEIRGTSPGLELRPIPNPGVGRALKLLSFAARAARVARADSSDLVLSFARIFDADMLRSGGSAHASYVRAARRWQSPVGAVAMRLSPYHRIQIMIERRGFRAAQLRCAIAVSELVRRDLVEIFAIPPAKVATLYNGVDLERFRPALRLIERGPARAELGLHRDTPAVVFVGNGFARKGLRFLIEAWPKLDSSAILVVAGTDRNATRYQQLAERTGVGDRVMFLGARSQVERLFAAGDALALPSLFEPFGNVVMEAMAAGLPALCSTACGAAETLPRAFNDFVVNDPTNREELAARLRSLISAADELRAIARATAERYTWQSYAANLLRLIEEL